MKKKIFKILLFDLLMIVLTMRVSAASFTISAGNRNLTKGGTTKLTIKGTDLAGRFNITTSNSNIVSISEDRVWIDNNSYSVTLTAHGVGTATIKVTPSDVSGYNSSAAGLTSKSINITVSLPREKSSDNNLSSLSVEGYTITPEFSKDVKDYKVSVPEGVSSVIIIAVAASKYATITGGGKTDVTDGVNNISIVVKSETGVDKVYNLVIDVLDQNPINVEVDGIEYTIVKLRKNFTCPEDFEESEVVISDNTIPACVNKNINYTLIGLKDAEGNIKSYVYNANKNRYSLYSYAYSNNLKVIITDEKALENSEKVTIKIDDKDYNAYKYGNSERYYVVYGTNVETGENNFYLYDSKNKTFSTYDVSLIDSLEHQNEIYLYVIIVFGIGLFLSIICIISLNSKKNKIIKRINKKEEETIEETKEDKKEEIVEDNVAEEETSYDIFEEEKKKKKAKKK